MTGARIPIKIPTDSEILLRVIIKSTVTTEKRLMVYIRAVRKAYQVGEISEVGWIR